MDYEIKKAARVSQLLAKKRKLLIAPNDANLEELNSRRTQYLGNGASLDWKSGAVIKTLVPQDDDALNGAVSLKEWLWEGLEAYAVITKECYEALLQIEGGESEGVIGYIDRYELVAA